MQAHQRQERLDKLLKQYMLRRTKESTIRDQLPKKMDNIVFCKLAALQMRAYRQAAACLSDIHVFRHQQQLCCFALSASFPG